jgi:hypothetical protein
MIMNTELLSQIIQVVFEGHLKYIAPFLFLIMITLFSQKLIDLMMGIFSKRKFY